MKKLFSLFIALTFACSISAFAQPEVTLGNPSGTSPQDVPVSFDLDNETVQAFDLTIAYPSGVSFVGAVDVHALLIDGFWEVSDDPGAGTVLLSWSKTVGTNPDISNGDLVSLRFSGPVGTHLLTFVDPNTVGVTELYEGDDDTAPLTSTFTNGSVTFVAPVPLSNWAIFIGLGLIIAFLVVRFRRIV